MCAGAEYWAGPNLSNTSNRDNTTAQHTASEVELQTNLRLTFVWSSTTQQVKPGLTLGVVHVSSGWEVDDVVVELLPAEPLDQGGGDEGLPHAGLAHHHQRQLVLDTQVQEIFLAINSK